MTAFIWIMIIVCAVSAIGELSFLAKQEFPRRNPAHEAIDVLINFCLIAWALSLL